MLRRRGVSEPCCFIQCTWPLKSRFQIRQYLKPLECKAQPFLFFCVWMDWRLRRFLLCSFPRQRQLVAVCIALADTRSEHVGLSGRSRWGARVYNAIHSYGAPAALALCALLLRTPAPLPFALIWLNHIGVDRLLGCGLKYPHGFTWTHLDIHVGRLSSWGGVGIVTSRS